MHVAAGLRMLDDGAVLRTDPFSWTFQGQPWQTHEWLSEVVMALAWRVAGWSGVALLTAAAAGLTAGLMARHVGRWLKGPVLVAVLVLGFAALSGSLLARPHLLALPCLEMWAAELVIARSEGRTPALIRLVPLMAVWANLHGSFLFGLALLGPFGLESVIKSRVHPTAVLRWVAIGLACGAAALISPHGVDNLTFPLRLMGMKTLAGIGEWAPLDPLGQPAFVLTLTAGGIALLRVGRRIPLLHLSLFVLLTWMAFHQARHVLLFGVVAPLLAAEPLGWAVLRRNGGGESFSHVGRPAWTACVVGMAAIAAVRLYVPVQIVDGPTAPVSALAQAPTSLRAQRGLQAYGFGGYLIFNGVRPFIDSRAEVYGDAFREAYGRLAAGDRVLFERETAARGWRWALVETDGPLASLLEHEPGWRRLFRDRYAVLFALSPRPPGTGPDRRPAGS